MDNKYSELLRQKFNLYSINYRTVKENRKQRTIYINFRLSPFDNKTLIISKRGLFKIGFFRKLNISKYSF